MSRTIERSASTFSSPLRSALVALALVACGACGALLYAHDRGERARVAELEQRLAQSRADLAEARALRTDAPSTAPIVTVRGADPELANAVAARVAAAQVEREKSEAAIAENASAPTPEQLAGRAKAHDALDVAVGRGVLRRDDVLAMRRALDDDAAGRAEAARQIAVAMNTGKLVPEAGRLVLP
jgi:hypothetical protein